MEFLELPIDSQLDILEKLDIPTLTQLGKVNTTCRRLCSNERIWGSVFHRLDNTDNKTDPTPHHRIPTIFGTSWKARTKALWCVTHPKSVVSVVLEDSNKMDVVVNYTVASLKSTEDQPYYIRKLKKSGQIENAYIELARLHLCNDFNNQVEPVYSKLNMHFKILSGFLLDISDAFIKLKEIFTGTIPLTLFWLKWITDFSFETKLELKLKSLFVFERNQESHTLTLYSIYNYYYSLPKCMLSFSVFGDDKNLVYGIIALLLNYKRDFKRNQYILPLDVGDTLSCCKYLIKKIDGKFCKTHIYCETDVARVFNRFVKDSCNIRIEQSCLVDCKLEIH